MNTHVFIVDNKTFKIHLEYMFAGTGSKEDSISFLFDNKSLIHHSAERNLVSMLADISRVQVNDNIIFYLQATIDNPGMFFGIFRVTSTPFIDENDDNNYLKNKLEKGLTFRVLIKPFQVFPLGITEHEYLDSISDKERPYHLNWSLIYRKLKGNRGCTMITEFEFLDLKNKLEKKNNFPTLNNSWIPCNSGFSYDSKTNSIIQATFSKYSGRKCSFDITNRLFYKFKKKQAFETHLQAYLLQSLKQNPYLKNLVLPLSSEDFWIGNEVSCGVGMQSIDILIIQTCNNSVYIKIIELKDEEPSTSILSQIEWYIQWVQNYIVPNYIELGKYVHIIPCIIAKNSNNFNLKNYYFSIPNLHKKLLINQLEFIYFYITDSAINFVKK